ncbi:hypothetical protein [uncultured Methanolobus sp.]|uniref:hypothetical protein n=1 Tax=uncultured Methanolobus sp. TaxID=218300 RepID=UPI0029C88D72|nr:hypothetical protein [uncultured Methanolobus sp.]
MQTKVTKGLSMPKVLYDKIEQKRGKVPRSVVISDILMEHYGIPEEVPEPAQTAEVSA